MGKHACDAPYTYVVYLIHTAKPIGTDKHSVQHYSGSAADLYERMRVHRSGSLGDEGRAARILAAANDRSIPYAVVRVWHAGKYSLYDVERKVKGRKRWAIGEKPKRGTSLRRKCPICNPALWRHRTRFVEPGREHEYQRITEE